MFLYSIIMPAFNAEKNLEKSINSVIRQSYENWELIVVDDGSTDNTLKEVIKYAEKDDRIKVFTQKNAGPGAARNFGISKCKGDYVAFIDSDDYYDVDYLSLVNAQNEKSPKDIVFIDFVNETNDGKEYDSSNIYALRNLSKHDLICMQMTGKMPWGPTVKVIKRTLAETCLFLNLDVGEEIIFSFDVLRRSESLGFVSKPLYHYVHNDKGQHKKGGLDPWGTVVIAMKEHLTKYGCFKEYESTINSFALRSLCISVYRCSCEFERGLAIKKIEQAFNSYKIRYDFFDLNLKALDKKSIIILVCLKCKLFFLIYYASKARKNKQK